MPPDADFSGQLQQPIEDLTISNSLIREAQLTGILVGWDNAWKRWAASSPTDNGCDAPLATGFAARVPRRLKLLSNVFWDNWTGTVALNDAWKAEIQDNFSLNNYTEDSWDGGGGTILDAECVIGSKWNRNLFLNKKLSPNILTSAFESKGRGMPRPQGDPNPTLDYTFITNNEIVGQPMEAIDLASTSHTVVSGNTIIGANRGFAGAVINVRNVGSWRASTEIVISGNKFRTDVTIPSLSYALVAVGGCQEPYGTKGNCSGSGISNVTVTGNENTTSPLLPLFCRNPLVAPNGSITNILGFDAVNTPLCGLP